MAPGEGGACDREAAPRVAEGVLGVGAVVGFGAAVDLAGDVVAWFERGRGADCFHGADDSSPRIFRWVWGYVEATSHLIFGGSSWYWDLYMPNSAGAALVRPAALTRTRTQSEDVGVGLG